MHIVFLLPDIKGGGAEKVVINLTKWLAGNGHKCEIVTVSAEGDYEDLVSPDVSVRSLNKSLGKTGIPFVAYALRQYIKSEQPDILCSSLFYGNFVCILGKLLLRTKTRLIIRQNTHNTRAFQSLPLWKRLLWPLFLRYSSPFCDHIICVSDGVRQDAMTYLPAKTHRKLQTINNPVFIDSANNTSDKKAGAIFPKSCNPKLIAAGRLMPQKDYPTMISAFARYVCNNERAHLVILGSGPQEEMLKSLAKTLKIEQHVTFAGFVTNPLDYMRKADIFISTSAWEGFPNVHIDALYSGLKIVATDCPSGPSEILENGKHGALCEVGDVAGIAAAIDKTTSKDISSDTQKKRALDFHVDKIGKQYLECFKSVMAAD